MKRFLKQFVIAAIYLLIFSGIGLLAWNIFYTPTCFDGIKNQGEEEVDCGGPCQSCEIKTLSYPIVLRKFFLLDPEGNAFDAAIQLKNPNLNWGLKSFDYQIDFKDVSGYVLPGSLYGKSFLMPNAGQWLMETAKFAPAETREIELKINTSTIEWSKIRPYVAENEFVIRDQQFKLLSPPASGYAEATGAIENKSSFNVNDVEIQAVLYDKDKRLISFGRTTIFSLRQGEVREFRIFWPKKFVNRNPVAGLDILANINFLADESFLQRYQY
ncbi:MAG: FxLYD domain-containing protein [Patescibacteria group bacterium]